MCAVYATYIGQNRTARRQHKTSDKIALSFVLFIIEK